MTPFDYDYLRKLLKEHSGLDLSPDKQYLIESRLLPLSRKSGLSGIAELVQWRNQIDTQETAEAYGKALLCVLPYTGSFAGWPAVNALTYGTAVIATRRAGLPEHLGEAAVWIPENDSQSLAEAILRLLTDERARQELVASGRTRAESLFGWDTIAAKTMTSYKAALDHKRAGAGR